MKAMLPDDEHVLRVLDSVNGDGSTKQELGDQTGWAYGDIEGALERLEKRGYIKLGWHVTELGGEYWSRVDID